MRPVPLVSALVLAQLPTLVHAQEFPITIKPTPGGGATVQMGPDNSADESTTATHQYRFESGPLGRSVLEVKSPMGARCEVSDQGQVHRDVVPFAVGAVPDTYNRVVCQLPGGGVFDGKFVARRHTRGVLIIKGPTGPATGAEPPPPGPPPPTQPPSPPVQSPPPAAPAPRAMEDAAFGKLMDTVRSNSFDNQKVAAIRVAANRNHFSTEQVGRLVDAVTFGAEKVHVVETTRLRIVDPENAASLLDHFTFDSEKKKVAALLESLPPSQAAPQDTPVPGQAAPAPVNAPMEAAAFNRLLSSLRAQSFDAQKIQAIQVATRNNRWTVGQVGQMVDLVSAGSDKVRVVEITRDQIVDPEHAAELLEHFTFDADKRRAAKLLGR